MWDYTEKTKDHFLNPRNVGFIDDFDGIGEVGSLSCGDALKLTFKLGDDQRIADAKFQTFGCASAIASSSALTEMIKGMTVDEADGVSNQDIAEFLGGLPEQKMHCSVMGREALEVAIENHRTGRTSKKILEGKVICNCFGITEDEIQNVVRDNRLTTSEQVTNYCKAGGGCGGCIPKIDDIIESIEAERRKAAAPTSARPMTVLEKIRLIEETMERDIRPMLRRDGGDLDLIDVDGDRVVIAFRGMCAQCNVAEVTMKDVVEAKLREFVSPVLTVEESQS